jgi:hypothetical protein
MVEGKEWDKVYEVSQKYAIISMGHNTVPSP